MVIGFDGTALSPQLRDLLIRIQPAGVVLFARNIQNAQQTHRLLKDCQSRVDSPLFTLVDLEGGRVDRFRHVLGPAPSAADVFATRNRRLYRLHGEIIGRSCAALGFNTDLAPVLDLAFEASRSVMGSRAFSTDPEAVAAYARAFLKGLESARVFGCGKHFPGLGEGTLDSHHELPIITKSFPRIWAEDLAPYRTIKRDLAIVLVNHANYPRVTRDKLPASLSKYWITDVLRKKLGFRGLVLSDDLEMGGVLAAASIEGAAVEFIRAGGDLGLLCHRREGIEASFRALAREAERSPAFRRRVAESGKRLAAFKRKYARRLRLGPAPNDAGIARIKRQLWEFSERVRLEQLARTARAGA